MNTVDSEPDILMVSTSLHGKGGIASVISTYMAGGLDNNFNIRLFVTHAGETKTQKILTILSAVLKLPGILISTKYKIFHVHTSSRLSFLRKSVISWLGLFFGKKIILHLHGSEFMQFYNDECSSITQWYISKTFSSVDRVVVLSSQWKEQILSISKDANVDVIFNPISINNSEGISENAKKSLLFLGRVGERKGFWDILNALVLVKKVHPDFIFKYGGDGELEKASKMINELGLVDNVEYLGWVSGDDKQAVLDQSLIYLLPSYNEGLPMGILEAMASKIPVITCPIGGIPDAIFNDINGLLVPPGDVEALAGAIIKLLDSRKLRDKLADKAFDDVLSTFSTERVVPQVESLYLELLSD